MPGENTASSWITAVGEMIESYLATAYEKYGDKLTERLVTRAIQKTIRLQSRIMIKKMTRDRVAPEGWEADTQAFERRNLKRWKPAFESYEKCWQAAREITAEFDRFYRPEAAGSDDYLFDALATLNTRALLVGRECMALMRAGFAEGALVRWRALHELSTTSAFIAAAGSETAYRYLLSFQFQSYKAALQIDEYIGKGTADSFTDEEIEQFRTHVAALIKEHGFDLSPEYEWARPGLQRTSISAKKRITFSDIEAEVGREHMRPYYRWASQHNHAGHRPNDKGLGLSESTEQIALVGASNSGMVDPLQLASLSVLQCATHFLMQRVTIDTTVHLTVLADLQRRVAPIALRREALTFARARKKHVATERAAEIKPGSGRRLT